ncbi:MULTISPECIES: iron ABC transporter permease [unclassified Devosia]|uniref:FecCD family ABC transporter permease n=1 Tax=unclassified Devosia TaxID=196773 RepID=UPI00145F9D38|nr:iron ABC transporter permease [Devosia sp. MC521]MBJ6987862.1 iron ABC transporter permease [Devosia sp. MC521]QMW63766.1 iron ABC transporter permease [Devosia sp. MC521]
MTNRDSLVRRTLSGAALPITCVCMIAASLFAMNAGRYGIDPVTVIKVILSRFIDIPVDWNARVETVIFNIRLPRIGVALLVGACLASSGVSFQGVFRNPLVSPFLLGVSAGAGFGAAVAILQGGGTLTIQLYAFAFGGLAVIAAVLLARLYKNSNTLVLILSGTITSSVFTALLGLLKYTADTENKLPVIEYWLLGSLSAAGTDAFINIAVVAIPAMVLVYLLRWRLNLLTSGDEQAQLLGVNVKRERILHITLGTLLCAAAVSTCGIVGWVGLVAPHLARMIVGPDHVKLIPMSMALGATFLLIVDTLARTLVMAEIPLGIVTALVGAPFFAVLLARSGKGWS